LIISLESALSSKEALPTVSPSPFPTVDWRPTNNSLKSLVGEFKLQI